jgi:hypothetical protein
VALTSPNAPAFSRPLDLRVCFRCLYAHCNVGQDPTFPCLSLSSSSGLPTQLSVILHFSFSAPRQLHHPSIP